MTNHAACSPSSANMWLACPASVTMTRDKVRPSSKFAREGTAAHHVAELNLKGDIFLPDKVAVEGEEFIVSRGMCEALNPYVSFVQGLRALKGSRGFLEHRLVVPDTYGMVWGTLDCGVYVPGDLFHDGVLHIADLKYGRGHVVEPDTPQLKLYALALAGHIETHHGPLHDSTEVVLTICQPRIPSVKPIRSYGTLLGTLRHWRHSEVEPAVQAIKYGDTSESAGSHCRWCVRQTECKAFAGLHQSRASNVFDDADQQVTKP